jgi:hypothetical protein
MARTHRITCECGGEIERPIPPHCPHCGAQIVGVRRSTGGWLLAVLVIGGVFAALVAVLIMLAT